MHELLDALYGCRGGGRGVVGGVGNDGMCDNDTRDGKYQIPPGIAEEKT